MAALPLTGDVLAACRSGVGSKRASLTPRETPRLPTTTQRAGAMFQFDFFLKNSFGLVGGCSQQLGSCLRAMQQEQAAVAAGARGRSCVATWRGGCIPLRPPCHPTHVQIFATFFVFQLALISVAFLLSSECRRAMKPGPGWGQTCLVKAGWVHSVAWLQ